MFRVSRLQLAVVLCVGFYMSAPRCFAADNVPISNSPNVQKTTQNSESANPSVVKQDGAAATAGAVKNASSQPADSPNAEQEKQLAAEQARQLNKLPGPKADPDDLREDKDTDKEHHFSFNPLHWLFGPVLDLQKQSVRLEQQMVKMTGPISALQPAMLQLDKKLEHVNSAMGTMGTQLDTVGSQMTQIHQTMRPIPSDLSGIQKDMKPLPVQIKGIRQQMSGLPQKLSGIEQNMTGLPQRLSGIAEHMNGVNQHMNLIDSQMTNMRNDLSGIHKELVSIRQPIVSLRDPIVRLESPVEQLRAPVAVMGSRMNKLEQDIVDLKNLIAVVLTSIYVAAFLIAVGTPVAAIVLYRHRAQWFASAASRYAQPEDAKLRHGGPD